MACLLISIWGLLLDVILFWQQRFKRWLSHKNPVDVLFDILRDAKNYEEWERAAIQLDVLTGRDLWRQNPTSKHYDFRLIHQRFQSIIAAREVGDYLQLVNLLRSGLVRNLGNISTPRIFNCAFAGTKLLIEEYIIQVTQAIADVTKLPTTPGDDEYGINTTFRFSSQDKLDLLHDTRQAFGRSTLILQGGAIFGLCHLGVVKALLSRGLLPKIISGTATGALIAALVGIHTEDELPKLLNVKNIDLTAFYSERVSEKNSEPENKHSLVRWWIRIKRSFCIFLREGYFLDVRLLEKCMRANVGDITFEEAYSRTKRVLNITVATTGRGGVPNLLNYLTAPNVLIWSAAIASNTSSRSLHGCSPILKCKDASGKIIPWSNANDTTFRPWTHASYTERDSPLARIAELFNVNHFIVSQARPHLVPFLQSDIHGPSTLLQRWGHTSLIGSLLRLMGMELDHRAHQLETLGLLPPSIRRFFVNDHIPGTPVMLVPKVSASDFFCLLETPTEANLNYWILQGEKSVWPAVVALKVRCAIETELDRSYQFIRRRETAGLYRRSNALETNTEIEKKTERIRADSLNGKW
ncbi:hypothetical protein Golomagni_02729 [Golovinomyces magnicellulatus]|nr:hypothetical protein Golomagni_02729 [Golovinomyces magnicellulatus]